MISLPNKAVKYILFQRTEYLIYQNNNWLNKIVIRIPFLTYNRMVAFEAWILKSRIKRLFFEDMQREYESIKASLPESPSTILDIGSGVAGIDVMIFHHYEKIERKVDFFLLDKTELDDRVYYGLEKTASYYNSLDIARELLVENGVSSESIHTQEATGGPLFPGIKFDLVLSLISWGFHYPVETYLDSAYHALKAGGKLIIDIRKGSGGERLIEEKFAMKPTIVKDAKKYQRIVVQKEL